MRLEDVIDHVIEDILNEIPDIIREYPEDKQKTNREGDIGELIFGRAIKYAMLEMSYIYNEKDIPNSFWIIPKYRRNKYRDKVHGIDFKLDILDNKERKHVFLIESKNWDSLPYYITPDQYSKKILKRFKDNDPAHNWHWIVTMNKGNVNSIEDACFEHGIDIIYLDSKITEDITKETLKPVVISFVYRFINMLKHRLGKLHNKIDERCIADYKNPTEGIRLYLRYGVPEKIIAKVFGDKITKQYISKIKYQIKKDGIPVIDRKSKRGRYIREL